jgi:hypothetical protein
MALFLGQAEKDSALYLSSTVSERLLWFRTTHHRWLFFFLAGIVIVASQARTERLLRDKQSLYLQLSYAPTSIYEKLKLFHLHNDKNEWRSPRGPIPIPM